MYLATMLEYLTHNTAFYGDYPKEDYYQFYRGHPVWEIFDYYILYEFAFKEQIGKPIKP